MYSSNRFIPLTVRLQPDTQISSSVRAHNGTRQRKRVYRTCANFFQRWSLTVIISARQACKLARRRSDSTRKSIVCWNSNLHNNQAYDVDASRIYRVNR